MFNLTSAFTSRTWRDNRGGKHKATRVFTASEVPADVCVVRSSHSPEVCHCGTCQKFVREKFDHKEISFVDYVPWEVTK